jgi:3-hydroxyisobutyrate dehydrogenase
MSVLRVGFVGLGKLGEPASRCLHQAGFSLALYDRDAALARKLAEEYGAGAAGRLEELASCELVVTALPDGKAVREAALQMNLPAGAVLVDMSSSAPADTQALAKELRAGVVDAPVSGGVKAAKTGDLVFMVGGKPEDVARARPLLDAMGASVTHVGPSGAGHALKAINNYIAAAGYIACCEGLLAGKRFGLDPRAMLDVIDQSSGMSYNTRGKFRQHVLPRSWGSGFGLGHMAKDVRIALEIGRDTGTPFRLGERCSALWDEAAAALEASADHTEFIRLLEQATGTRL